MRRKLANEPWKVCFYWYTLYSSNACISCHFLCFWAREAAGEKFWVEGFRTTCYNPGKPGPIWGQNLRPVSFSLICVVGEGLTTVCLHPSAPALSSRQLLLLFLSHCERWWVLCTPLSFLLIPEAKGIQELRNIHANSKYGSELKINKDFKDKVKHKNWIGLPHKHCFSSFCCIDFDPFVTKFSFRTSFHIAMCHCIILRSCYIFSMAHLFRDSPPSHPFLIVKFCEQWITSKGNTIPSLEKDRVCNCILLRFHSFGCVL